MKCIHVSKRGSAEVLEFAEVSDPLPGHGEVCIQVEAAGCNYADVMQHLGTYPLQLELPYTPGMEAVGRVASVGEGVDEALIGKRVGVISFVAGAYAEKMIAPSTGLIPIGDEVDAGAILALMIQGVTAFALLDYSGKLSSKDRVLIHAAAGGVGHLAVQIAKKLGSTHVTGVIGDAEKSQELEALGADTIVSRRNPEAAKLIAAAGPYDIILDPVGKTAFELNQSVLAEDGRLVFYGWLSGQTPEISAAQSLSMLFANHALVGFAVNVLMDRNPDYVTACLKKMVEWVEDGSLRPNTGARYTLETARQAHQDISDNVTSGKVIIQVS